jgi:Tol biopolymer transport system component/DNA-binding winged helix-turn-helix (wHTH) protein
VSSIHSALHFGVFDLDTRTGELRKAGVKLRVPDQSVRVLMMLLERPGELITREELKRTLWPDDTIVDFDTGINQAVKRLRQALGDTAVTPRFIETLPRRGYRFIAQRVEVHGRSDRFSLDGAPSREADGGNEAQAKQAGEAHAREAIKHPEVGSPNSRRTQWLRWTRVVTGILALTVTIFWGGGLLVHKATVQEPRTVPFTTLPGGEYGQSFSPDGKQMAFVWTGPNGRDPKVYVKKIGSEEPIRVSTGRGLDCRPMWSPDAQWIVFFRYAEEGCGYHIVSSMDGRERKFIPVQTCVNAAQDWLHDGRHLVVADVEPAGTESAPTRLSKLAIDTGERTPLTAPPANIRGDACPVVSPDGKMVCFYRMKAEDFCEIYLIPVGGGQPRLLYSGTQVHGVDWTPNGREIIFSTARASKFQIWRIPVSGGVPQAITSGAEDSLYPAVARRGNRLAYELARANDNLWRIDLDDSKSRKSTISTQLVSSTHMQGDPQYSPDGRSIAFWSDRSGSPEIWTSDPQGHAAACLTHLGGPPCGAPYWSPRGDEIAFEVLVNGNWDIFAIRSDGTHLRQITAHPGEDRTPSWSHDGKWIYFSSNRTGRFQIWRVFAAGGESAHNPAVQVTVNGGYHGVASIDGRYLYFLEGRDESGLWRRDLSDADSRYELVLDSLHTWGAIRRRTDTRPAERLILGSLSCMAPWALSRNGVYYFDVPEPGATGDAHLKFFEFGTKRTRDLLVLQKPVRIFSLAALSPDNRQLVYAQVDEEGSDIMLVENFR